VFGLSYRITVSHLNIGGHKVRAHEGLSELLEKCWTTKLENDGVLEFVSKYNRTVYRNTEGRLVTRYAKR
jgi:hypothetical protein